MRSHGSLSIPLLFSFYVVNALRIGLPFVFRIDGQIILVTVFADPLCIQNFYGSQIVSTEQPLWIVAKNLKTEVCLYNLGVYRRWLKQHYSVIRPNSLESTVNYLDYVNDISRLY